MRLTDANLLSIPAPILKKKWKYLRDQFAVEFGRIPISRSGDAAHSNSSKWQFYNSLLFLQDIVKPRPSSGNLSKVVTSDTQDSESTFHETMDEDGALDSSLNEIEASPSTYFRQ